jgi:peptide/nickel transport system permease protein
MSRYILGRLGQIVITLLIFQTLLFVILDAQPGDITLQFLDNPNVNPEAREQLRANLGLDRPALLRYLQWLRNFVTGNLGVSFQHWPRPVIEIIAERLPRTVVLFLTAQIISFFLGFTLGKQLAWRRGGFFEYSVTTAGVFLFTVFTPWFGLMVIWLFAFRLDWLPIGKFLDPLLWRESPVDANYVFSRLILTGVVYGMLLTALSAVTSGQSPRVRRAIRWGGFAVLTAAAVSVWSFSGVKIFAWDMLKHFILPICVYTLVTFAGTMLLTRNTMLETLREDFIVAARAKGLPESRVRDAHAARNALLPVLTGFIIALPFALSGGIITETVFSWPGMGLTLLQAVQNEDIPLAMGALSVVGVLALAAHLFADILYAFIDPRIRYQ